MLVPAGEPTLRIEASLQKGAKLPEDAGSSVTELLHSDEDGYAVRVSTPS